MGLFSRIDSCFHLCPNISVFPRHGLFCCLCSNVGLFWVFLSLADFLGRVSFATFLETRRYSCFAERFLLFLFLFKKWACLRIQLPFPHQSTWACSENWLATKWACSENWLALHLFNHKIILLCSRFRYCLHFCLHFCPKLGLF